MPAFDHSVFINCPFDEDYEPILQAIAFCVIYLGFHPRLAPENADNGTVRLERIADLIRGSKYAIHDLSRCKSTSSGEFARMNMPFELGLDHAAKRFGEPPLNEKRILILEHSRYDYQRSLSDIAGWDIQSHDGEHEKAVRRVRSWLVNQAGAPQIGAARIQGKYLAFQEWYYERELSAGSSEDDIREYPTNEMLVAMTEWREAGEPT